MAKIPDGETVDTGVPAHLAPHMTTAEQYDWHRSFLRRHPVSRRNFLMGSAAAAAAVGTSSAWSSIAYAQDAPLAVGGRHLAFGNDPSSQLRFSGQLSRNPGSAGVFLDHGPTPALGSTTRAEVRNLLSQVPQTDGGILSAEQFYVHAPVDGLPSKVPHYYRWRTTDGFVGDTLSASPALPTGRIAPFRFTMMGDQGVDETPTRPPGLAAGDYDDLYYKPDNDPSVKHAQNINRQIAAARGDFHILAGDIAYADPSGGGKPVQFAPSGTTQASGFDKYNPFVWDGYFTAIEASAAVTPWLFATGNHDIEALYGPDGYGGHAARLDQPTTGPQGCPSVYSFSYGNVAVLSLDANDVSYEITSNTGYSGGAQSSWVRATLAAYRSDPGIDFVVCFFHHCAYSTTEAHASDGGVRDAWTALFDEFSVDVVMQAHNHVFERTDPIRGGRPTRVAGDLSTVNAATDGTVYYTVGGGGRPRYAFQDGEGVSYRGNELADTAVPNSYVWAPDGTKSAESVPWSRVRFRNYSFITVDVSPGLPGLRPSEMAIAAIDEYGNEFDRVTFRRDVPVGPLFGS